MSAMMTSLSGDGASPCRSGRSSRRAAARVADVTDVHLRLAVSRQQLRAPPPDATMASTCADCGRPPSLLGRRPSKHPCRAVDDVADGALIGVIEPVWNTNNPYPQCMGRAEPELPGIWTRIHRPGSSPDVGSRGEATACFKTLGRV